MPGKDRAKHTAAQSKLMRSYPADEELVKLCRMMRLMSERDTSATLPQVLKALMLYPKGQPVGGSELSEISGINRITVIHHLKRLKNAGLVKHEEGKYILKVRSAEEMILAFRKEMEKAFQEMDEMAREFDEQFALLEQKLLEDSKGKKKGQEQ